MEELEEWRYVVGFEDYMVSNLGNVKSLNYMKTHKEKLLKQQIDKDGYHTVCIKQVPRKVHRLVAQAFIPNPNSLPLVNHKDEDKGNNKVPNLEWCTYKYNNTYNDRAIKSGKKNKKSLFNSNTKFRSKPVLCHQNSKIYMSQTQAGKHLNVNDGNIGKVIKGIYKHTGGYTFSYATKEDINNYTKNNKLDDDELWMIDFIKTNL